jgi:hypothetical protein
MRPALIEWAGGTSEAEGCVPGSRPRTARTIDADGNMPVSLWGLDARRVRAVVEGEGYLRIEADDAEALVGARGGELPHRVMAAPSPSESQL